MPQLSYIRIVNSLFKRRIVKDICTHLPIYRCVLNPDGISALQHLVGVVKTTSIQLNSPFLLILRTVYFA